ncbi:MAG: hypothetical protein QNL62_17975 [Gammaproteobacteria bacterium]|nr:hypothetical protein [Gammaproteobacteria bacterium]
MLSLIPEDDIRESVLAQYYMQGRLLRVADGKKTRPVNPKLSGCKLPRGYFFKPKNNT